MNKNTLFRQVDRKTLENIPAIIALHDPQNNIVWANKLYQEATGLCLSEIEGKKCYSVWGLEKPCRGCPVLKTLETGEPAEAELTPSTQDHWPESLGFWLSKAEPIRDEKDNVIGAIEVAIDISVRKKAEEELSRQRAMLSRTESIAHVGSWEWDISRDHVTWSEELFNITGLDPAEGAPCFAEQSKLYLPDDMQRLREAVDACRADGTPYELEVQIIRPDGERRHCIDSGQAEIEPDGQVYRLVGFLQDITDSRQVEKALRESEQKFHSLVEQAAEMLFLHDTDGRFLDVNKQAEKSTGYSREELLSMSVFDVDPDSVNRSDQERIWKSQMPESPPKTFQVRHKRKDGSIYPAEVIISKIALADGEYILALARDITERKEAEDALLEQRAMLARTESIAHVGSWECDISNDRVTWSEEMFKMMDLDPAEGAPSFEEHSKLFLPEDMRRMRRAVDVCRKDKTPYEVELRAIMKNGEIRYCLVSGRAETGPDGQVSRLVGFLQDITERRKQEEEKERLREQLIQARRIESVGRLAGGVAHDFNNMLSVILGYTEMAKEQISPDHPLNASLEEILTAAKRSRDITRQLLAFARKQTISPVVMDINKSISKIISFLDRMIGEDIELDWQPGDGLFQVKMDASQIDQILVNLCVNARDAIKGAGKISIKTGKVTLDETFVAFHPGFVTGEFVLISVTDNGCGMDRKTLESVFEPFFTTKEMAAGTGLGLATVYGIVKQNNGQIDVFSEPGKGTRFKLYLPIHKGAGSTESADTQEVIPEGRGEIILLVEDEDTILKMTSRMLEKLGYKLLAADSPEKGLELGSGHPGGIDMLLTDVVMPGMNGQELAKRLLGLHPDLKVLFMSGYTADVIEHRGVLDVGLNFLQKPFSRKDLAVKVRNALDQK